MSSARRWLLVGATATIVSFAAPPAALADPDGSSGPDASQSSADVPTAAPAPDFGPGPYNVVYRARVDGVSRGATINYAIQDDQVNTAQPTMVPGRTFEATGVVSRVQKAGMQVAIQWPYSASLHCEILVGDQIYAEADQFVAPRLTPQHDDPGYGVLSCGSVTNFPTGNTAPVDAAPPAEGAPPADAAAAPSPAA